MRQPKPYFRQQKQAWYVQIDGRQFSLGRDEKKAWQRYYELILNRADLDSETVTAAQLIDTFLEWCSKHRSKGTFENSRRYCRHFINSAGKKLTVAKLKPKHITEWIDRHPDWADTSKNDAISAVQRAMNWATKQGHIPRSPIAGYDEKPARQRREVVFSQEEFDKIRGACTDTLFPDLLVFMWETGCRPIEASSVEAKFVDLKHSMVVYPESMNKTRKGERVIFMTDRAREICERLLKLYPEGPIFRNRRGNAWTKNSMKCRFRWIAKKTGIERVCAYGIRHSFATEGLKNGVDSVSLSMLMGHSDVSMIARTYQHLAKNPEFLREQAKKAKGV